LNQYHKPYYKLRREILFDALEKFPDHGTLTIAKLIYSQNPEYFDSLEHTRNLIRMYRGSLGKEHRDKIVNKKYYRNVKPV